MRIDTRTLAGLVIGGLIGALAALATASAQQQEFSEQHLARTKQVIESLRVLNSFDQLLPKLAEQTRTLFVQNYPSLAAEIENSVNQAALSLVEKRKQLDDEVLEIWAKRFSEEEIARIADFFTSDAGQSFARQSGELLQESAVAAKRWGDQRSVEIVDLVREDLRRKGLLE